MRVGLALPQYDYSIVDERPLRWASVLECAREAARLRFDSLWVSDHLTLGLARYGGPDEEYAVFEPFTTLGALARLVPGPRLGTLVCCEVLRPATVLAKTVATLDRVCGGRLDVGIGAGWHEPDYAAIGMDMPPPGVRLARLREAVVVLRGMLGGDSCTFDGRYHHARDARNDPPPVQSPRPPIVVGGKGDRLLRLIADVADGWNTCWVWTPEAYQERVDALDQACAAFGRDPATVVRTLGLYALCGENEADLAARFERLRRASPPGVLDGTTLDEWRKGRLVGTVPQVAEQAGEWADLGVESLIVAPAAVPFALGALDDLEPLAAALSQS